MKNIALARIYVSLDRMAFLRLRGSADLRKLNDYVARQLQTHRAYKEFEELCHAGAEEQELLWILSGCRGFPGFYSGEQLFGLSASELKRGLASIVRSASIIENISRQPFGFLIGGLPFDSAELATRMRWYVKLAYDAQKDFGQGTEWFLNVAKARLVIHVTHHVQSTRNRRSKGIAYRDKEVSALIAAMTGGKYSTEAHSKWRNEHRNLIGDAELDSYTTQANEAREQSATMLEQAIQEVPEIGKAVERFISGYRALIQSRQ